MEKKKFNKKLLIPLFAVLAIGIVAASIYIATLHVSATVSEPLQVSSDENTWYTIDTNGLDFGTQTASVVYPHESVTLATIYLNNLASVDENVYLNLDGSNPDWTVSSNGYNLDGTATSVSNGNHVVILTATYNGETSGATYSADLTVGGTLQ
jgi:hypothetical protein